MYISSQWVVSMVEIWRNLKFLAWHPLNDLPRNNPQGKNEKRKNNISNSYWNYTCELSGLFPEGRGPWKKVDKEELIVTGTA